MNNELKNNKPLDNYIENIKKTGFLLEYNVTRLLQKHKWSVINNRYYLDDVSNVPREIDIIAYKTEEIKDLLYYTTLIISCKKDEKNDWAILTKELNKNDPNLNYYPVSNWTNERILKYMLEKTSILKDFIEIKLEEGRNNFISNIFGYTNHVFAFQQMDKGSGKVKDDKDIFNSISSLIRALAYEKQSLDKRIKNVAFYNFNLISIVESNLVKIFFAEDNINCEFINNINYINRFIVNNKDEFFKVLFTTYDNFEKTIRYFNALHRWNISTYSSFQSAFFDNLVHDRDRIEYQFEGFKNDLERRLFFDLRLYSGFKVESKELKLDYISWDDDKNLLIIMVDTKPEYINYLNESNSCISKTIKALAFWYNYRGSFVFEKYDLPF